MPGKYLEKMYVEHSYYHIYSRGINKEAVFRDQDDYAVFLNLFKRYLSNKPVKDNKGREYLWLHNDIQLLAFCLMRNHFHALVYQSQPKALTELFKGMMTTYGMYFNKKYGRVGPVFQSRFRANMVTSGQYLQHISRYIHLNPKDYRHWPYSSLPYYTSQKTTDWCQPDKILELFNKSSKQYMNFVRDYEDYKKTLDDLKFELANAWDNFIDYFQGGTLEI